MPDLISDLAISEYLEALASKSATPGGGSASALIAAQGTALLSMVCEFSRPRDESSLDINKKCSVTQTNLLRLVQKDVDTFNEVMNWYADKGSDQYQKATETAVTVSLDIMREASTVIDAAEYLSKRGNKNLISDVAIGAKLLSSGIESAYINVLVNLKTISNGWMAREAKEEAREYLQTSNRLSSIYTLIRGGL